MFCFVQSYSSSSFFLIWISFCSCSTCLIVKLNSSCLSPTFILHLVCISAGKRKCMLLAC
uniref:Uncharacterized protein n=1 Tax=Rhizophora mucronata TaxID=61149 RepID=A0A2P2NR00_RHIMU